MTHFSVCIDRLQDLPHLFRREPIQTQTKTIHYFRQHPHSCLDFDSNSRSLFNCFTISCIPGSFATMGDRLSSISVFLACTSINSGTFASSVVISSHFVC